MKFGNHVLKKSENVNVGDIVSFDMSSANYQVEEINTTKIGMVQHLHKTGSNSYWPNELLYVEKKNV